MMRVGEYMERLKSAARPAGFDLGYYGEVGDWGLPVLQRKDAAPVGHAYLSAGVHGDEPAACLALLRLLRDRALPMGLDYTLFPMVNPTGLEKGQRENADGVDLNRDYGEPVALETRAHVEWMSGRQFDLGICLHEDFDGRGFYLYSHFKDEDLRVLESVALANAAQVMPLDDREEIDGMPAKGGCVFPPEHLLHSGRMDSPEALRLFFGHGVRAVFTTETPSGHAIMDRVEAHVRVTLGILLVFLEKQGRVSI